MANSETATRAANFGSSFRGFSRAGCPGCADLGRAEATGEGAGPPPLASGVFFHLNERLGWEGGRRAAESFVFSARIGKERCLM